jgi:hypothetical protein
LTDWSRSFFQAAIEYGGIAYRLNQLGKDVLLQQLAPFREGLAHHIPPFLTIRTSKMK